MSAHICVLFPIYDNKKKGNAKGYRYEISHFKHVFSIRHLYYALVIIYSIRQKYSYDLHNERELARQSCFLFSILRASRLFWSFDFYLLASHIYGVKRSTSPLSANKSTIESSRSVRVQWKEDNEEERTTWWVTLDYNGDGYWR